MTGFAGVLIVLTIAGGIAVIIWQQVKGVRAMRRFDVAWYQAKSPQLVGPDNVHCFKCKNPDAGVERIEGRSSARRHFCRRCGSNLYFSFAR